MHFQGWKIYHQHKFLGDPAPPWVETPETLRVAQIPNAPSPRMGTHKTPASTIPYALTTRHMALNNKSSMIPQEEIYILFNLTEK